MDSEFEQISGRFSFKAEQLFRLTYENFRLCTEKLNRQKDENVFQQQLARYCYAFKLQLQYIARELLDRNNSLKDLNLLNKMFIDKINNYLEEFRNKSLVF